MTFSGVWVAVAFGYLPDKKLDSYSTFFSLLKTTIASNELELSARSIMSDFELNLRKAAKDAFVGLLLIGCHFVSELYYYYFQIIFE